ncbi:MAG: cell wall-binding protein, partial [Actinomyces bouchesdurhonensis]|nr:cell wall-binding protein [Actinomyces bouchesdurhonensis]
MKRIHIRFARCIVASVTTLACVGLFPLTAAHADVAASAAQSGAPTAPAATSASSEDTPTATPTP